MGDFKAIARVKGADGIYTLFRRDFGPLAERADEAQLDALVGMKAATIAAKLGKDVDIDFCPDGAFLLTIIENDPPQEPLG